MNKRWFVVGGVLLAGAVWAGTQIAVAYSLKINGKDVKGKTMTIDKETYIPVSALKAAGAVVTTDKGTLVINWAGGGQNQTDALEGKVGEWLFNGIWRFKVTAVVPNDDGRPGWKVGIEIRNGSKADNIATGGTGLESFRLYMADGIALDPYNITDFSTPGFAPGSGRTMSMVFYDDDGNGRKPEKLLVRFNPDEGTVNFLKGMGVGYTVKTPSFRINLKSDDGN